MKVLIISVKAGYGHHSTANALIEEFSKRNIECEMLDTFEYINPVLADSIDNGYVFSTKYISKLYGKVYDKLDKHDEKLDKHSFFAILSKTVSHKLKDYLKSYNPDIIIGTHSYAAMLMTFLKEEKVVSCPLIGIITDFTVHPFWENTEMDFYVVADAVMENQLNKKGISTSKMLPFGIPIRNNFSFKIDKNLARKKLGIEDKTTVLIMMGSMGFGNIIKKIQEIDALNLDFQIICVCGKNKKMFKEINSFSWNKTMLCYSFVDNVDVLMDASDCIVTKPGGLTTSELLAKKIPAIIMNPIRGQEDRNMDFLVNNGAAVMITKNFGLDEALFEVLKNPWRQQTLLLCAEHLGKPDSTKELCDFVEKMGNNDAI